MLGRALIGLGESEAGRAELRANLDQGGDSADLRRQAEELLASATRTFTEEQQRWYAEGVALCDPVALCKEAPTGDAARKRVRDGVALIDRFLAQVPDHWQSWWITGKGLQALGEHAEAYERFGKAFLLQPGHPDVAREHSGECLAVGAGDRAVTVARRALELSPVDAGLQANLALALLVAGDAEGAEKTAEAALANAPDDKITFDLLTLIREVRAGRRARPERWPTS